MGPSMQPQEHLMVEAVKKKHNKAMSLLSAFRCGRDVGVLGLHCDGLKVPHLKGAWGKSGFELGVSFSGPCDYREVKLAGKKIGQLNPTKKFSLLLPKKMIFCWIKNTRNKIQK